MSTPTSHFAPLARLLHWLMAVLLLAMLFIGVGMLSTLSAWHSTLLAIHKPLGVLLLLLWGLRLLVRCLRARKVWPCA